MTLTDTSKVVRRGIVTSIFIIIIYYVSIIIIIPLTKDFIAQLFPPKDPPTPIYGALPSLEFAQKEIKNDSPPTFKLDTKTGKLPADNPKKMTVYKFQKPSPSFEKGESAVNTAREFGFTDIDLITSLKESTYKWKNLASGGTMEVNTNTKEFTIYVPLEGRGELFARGELSYAGILKQATDLLQKIGRNQDPLYKEATNKISLGKIVNTRIQQIDNINDAQLARIDFFRKIDKYPILGPDPSKGLINFTIRKYDQKYPVYNYPFAEYHAWTIETQSNATYPIISINEAWEVLKNNKAVITNVTPKNEGNLDEYTPVRIESVFINSVYLAYYDSTSLQEYAQPIWVFDGTYTTSGTQGGTISYYYPAVTAEFIKLP